MNKLNSNEPKPTIMIIDDSHSFLTGIRNLLNETGLYQTICFTSPLEALSELSQNRPDVNICDLVMPELDGFQLIQKIKQEPKLSGIPVLVMTNQKDTDSMSKSIQFGVDAFCSKDTIRYTIEPHLLSLLRMKNYCKTEVAKTQFDTKKSMIGTYQHEFGNSLAIIEGMLRKYKKEVPDSKENACIQNIDAGIKRIQSTLDKLQELREVQFENYTEAQKILKVG